MIELGQLKSISSLFDGTSASLLALLQRVQDVVEGVEVVGLATRLDDEQFCIGPVTGDAPEHLRGLRFAVGEGFLGSVAATGHRRLWRDITQDPRSAVFVQRGVCLTALCSAPITWKQEVVGVLFAGFSAPVSERAEVLLEVLLPALTRQALVELMEEHLQVRTTRLTSLWN